MVSNRSARSFFRESFLRGEHSYREASKAPFIVARIETKRRLSESLRALFSIEIATSSLRSIVSQSTVQSRAVRKLADRAAHRGIRRRTCSSKDPKLFQCLRENWNGIPGDLVNLLIESVAEKNWQPNISECCTFASTQYS